MTLKGRDIVCVGFADWDTELWTNQHHLMSRLARDNRVLFVESLGLRRPQLAGRDLRRIARRLRRGVRPAARAVDGLHVLSPLVLPAARASRPRRALNAGCCPRLVRRAARRLGMRGPILWAYVPQAEVLLDALDPSLVVYHCVDDIAAQQGIDAATLPRGRGALRRAAPTSCWPARRRWPSACATLNDNVLYAPNVADTRAVRHGRCEPGPVDPALAALPRPRIVFTGAVVADQARPRAARGARRARGRTGRSRSSARSGPGDPHTDVVALRGRAQRPPARATAPYDGAAGGAARRRRRPDPLRAPRLTDSVFPMKVYEYLAAGLPVVATPLPALADVDEVATAPDAAGLAALLDGALAADDPAARAARSARGQAFSWESRLEQLGDVSTERPREPAALRPLLPRPRPPAPGQRPARAAARPGPVRRAARRPAGPRAPARHGLRAVGPRPRRRRPRPRRDHLRRRPGDTMRIAVGLLAERGARRDPLRRRRACSAACTRTSARASASSTAPASPRSPTQAWRSAPTPSTTSTCARCPTPRRSTSCAATRPTSRTSPAGRSAAWPTPSAPSGPTRCAPPGGRLRVGLGLLGARAVARLRAAARARLPVDEHPPPAPEGRRALRARPPRRSTARAAARLTGGPAPRGRSSAPLDEQVAGLADGRLELPGAQQHGARRDEAGDRVAVGRACARGREAGGRLGGGTAGNDAWPVRRVRSVTTSTSAVR